MTFQKTHALAGAGLAILGFAPVADARPVSYPGGWTVMQRNNGDFSSLHVHLSPTATDSIGLYTERNWDQDFQFTGVQYNRLLKRWNGPNSQANAYLKLGAGQADPFGDEGGEFATFAEFAADWETRRWFASYGARGWNTGDDNSVHHEARIGVAPYVGDYGDLHTWFMLQVENHPGSEETLTTTPLVRFFYDVQLVEIGYTVETEEILFNWIVRF